MLKTYFSTQFRKDLNKVRKRGLNTELLDEVILMLAAGKTLPSKYKDHALKNSRNYKNVRECHIQSDWLLVYRIDKDILTLFLMNTGTHSDLFKK